MEANPNAQALRSAVTDRLYWLRQEIQDSSGPLTLLDRLVAAEPKWPNYSQRASVHFKLEHWEQAARDELEAARLAGDRYWLSDSPSPGWTLGARLVLVPGRPREQYELALRWVEARSRAGVDENTPGNGGFRPNRTLTIGLAQFRLVLHPLLVFGYNRFSVVRASSILNCQSTPRCLAVVLSAQMPISD